MNYTEIVNLTLSILSTIITLLTLPFIIFGIIGFFTKKQFPETQTKLKYGIIIPARNEEAVVGNLIKSVYKNNYPQDKLQIFVIAHNCTDKTAEIARSLGATVYEYNNPNECTMGYAFKHLFSCIEKDFGTQNYDGFFIFNADNILSVDYFSKMNDAFVACDRKNVITSFRNSKNFNSNVMSGLYGLYFMSGCRLEARGRTVCNCSTRVQGTGYVINSEIVKNGWPYVTLTEDWEFSADQIVNGNKITYCDDAVFYDEQPTQTKVMLRQRLRWAKGYLLVCTTRYKKLLKNLFKKSTPDDKVLRFSTFDFLINITPFNIVSVFLLLIQIILLSFAPLFVADVGAVWLRFLIVNGISAGIGFVLMILQGILMFIAERKRVKNVSVFKKILICLTWPIFSFITIPIAVIAMFSKNVVWKTIPHTDTTNFEQLNNSHEKMTLLKNKLEEMEQESISTEKESA